MRHKLLIVLLIVLASTSLSFAQTNPTVEEALRQIDFKLVRLGVANPKPGRKSASHFIAVTGGFALLSIEGCTVTLRNEVVVKGRKSIYDAVIPLHQLSSEGLISESPGGVLLSKPIENPPEFYPWGILYRVNSRRRTVMLFDRVNKCTLARGAHVDFSVLERATLDKVEAAFRKAIDTCNRDLIF